MVQAPSARPGAAERMPALSLLSYNCFGVPTPSARRRLLALARELAARADDVVCLQEVQAHAYSRLLTAACAASHPYHSAVPFVYAPKGGLLTLSRAPIEAQEFVLFRARDVVAAPALMDWALHKGVLLTRLRAAGLPIALLNTHLSANYSADWSRENRYARVEWRQLEQLAGLVRAQPPEALVLVAGDFNIPRGSWLYREFLAASGLADPLAGDLRPSHRTPPGIPAHLARPIDYALLRAPSADLRAESAYRLDAPLALGARRVGFLSDHNAVELRLEWPAAAG